jgi:hypothetical protein
MTLEELNEIIAEAKARKPVSPQMTAADLCTAMRATPALLGEWAADGAPVNPEGKTDLFGLFEWLHANPNHPHFGAADERLVVQWKISRNV